MGIQAGVLSWDLFRARAPVAMRGRRSKLASDPSRWMSDANEFLALAIEAALDEGEPLPCSSVLVGELTVLWSMDVAWSARTKTL